MLGVHNASHFTSRSAPKVKADAGLQEMKMESIILITFVTFAVILIGAILIGMTRADKSIATIARQRSPVSFEMFIHSLNQSDADPSVCRSVFETLQHMFLEDYKIRQFPVHLTDRFDEDYLMASEYVEDIAKRAALKSGRCLKEAETIRFNTVEDLLIFLTKQKDK